MADPGLALVVFGFVAAGGGLLFWPRFGAVPRLRQLIRLSERVLIEDAIKHLYTCERGGRPGTLEGLAGRLNVTRARAAGLLSRLTAMGMAQSDAAGITLNGAGRQSAIRLVRTHRMWERYLADRTGVPAGEWHDEAERVEHDLSSAQVDALDERLGYPRWDPHGDPIPTPTGDMPPDRGVSLTAVEPGRAVEVVHLEDEPRELYDALVADGFVLGGRLDVVGRTDGAVQVHAGGRTWDVDPIAAGNVTVRRLPAGEHGDAPSRTLAEAQPGETVHVANISRACQGAQRRRLLDLGVVRGTPIIRELTSAGGDPVAYRIRGALIALRKSQAGWINIASQDTPVGTADIRAGNGAEAAARTT